MHLKKRKHRLQNKVTRLTTDKVRKILEELGWRLYDGSLEGFEGKIQFREIWEYGTMEVIVDKHFNMEDPHVVIQVTPCHPIEIQYAEEIKIAMDHEGDVEKIHQEIWAWQDKMLTWYKTEAAQ